MTHALTWFEIPVRDLDRAQRFYETLLATTLHREAMGPQTTLAVFPYAREAGGVGGCLMAGPGHAPAMGAGPGTMVYLPAGDSLASTLERLPAAGGRLLVPPVTLPDGMGAFAHVEDSEGNRVGLHAAH